ncbi:unnamed protein product [Bemisia tabaci]|uniref:Uncharacterized protein n=1 Tax=Bemisia tabaci TaxID=7038 RepID=A0A9P0A6Z6_BEMTA|nr:unnamed protein product [Bemisia tabaci]
MLLLHLLQHCGIYKVRLPLAPISQRPNFGSVADEGPVGDSTADEGPKGNSTADEGPVGDSTGDEGPVGDSSPIDWGQAMARFSHP